MNKKILSLVTACVLSLGLLCACGAAAQPEQTAKTVTPDVPVTGTWTIPGGSSVEYRADGTYTDFSKKNRTGTYTFLDEMKGFRLAKLFDQLEYVVCTSDKGKKAATGAVLQDLMIVYSELDNKELYYVRGGRTAVDSADLIGTWIDVYDNESKMEFTADGKLNAFEKTSAYTLGEEKDCGSSITVTDGDNQAVYAVLTYGDYLFLVRKDPSKLYLLVKESVVKNAMSQ